MVNRAGMAIKAGPAAKAEAVQTVCKVVKAHKANWVVREQKVSKETKACKESMDFVATKARSECGASKLQPTENKVTTARKVLSARRALLESRE